MKHDLTVELAAPFAHPHQCGGAVAELQAHDARDGIANEGLDEMEVGAAVGHRQDAMLARPVTLLPTLHQAPDPMLHVPVAFAAVLGKISELAERTGHEARK